MSFASLSSPITTLTKCIQKVTHNIILTTEITYKYMYATHECVNVHTYMLIYAYMYTYIHFENTGAFFLQTQAKLFYAVQHLTSYCAP